MASEASSVSGASSSNTTSAPVGDASQHSVSTDDDATELSLTLDEVMDMASTAVGRPSTAAMVRRLSGVPEDEDVDVVDGEDDNDANDDAEGRGDGQERRRDNRGGNKRSSPSSPRRRRTEATSTTEKATIAAAFAQSHDDDDDDGDDDGDDDRRRRSSRRPAHRASAAVLARADKALSKSTRGSATSGRNSSAASRRRTGRTSRSSRAGSSSRSNSLRSSNRQQYSRVSSRSSSRTGSDHNTSRRSSSTRSVSSSGGSHSSGGSGGRLPGDLEGHVRSSVGGHRSLPHGDDDDNNNDNDNDNGNVDEPAWANQRRLSAEEIDAVADQFFFSFSRPKPYTPAAERRASAEALELQKKKTRRRRRRRKKDRHRYDGLDADDALDEEDECSDDNDEDYDDEDMEEVDTGDDQSNESADEMDDIERRRKQARKAILKSRRDIQQTQDDVSSVGFGNVHENGGSSKKKGGGRKKKKKDKGRRRASLASGISIHRAMAMMRARMAKSRNGTDARSYSNQWEKVAMERQNDRQERREGHHDRAYGDAGDVALSLGVDGLEGLGGHSTERRKSNEVDDGLEAQMMADVLDGEAPYSSGSGSDDDSDSDDDDDDYGDDGVRGLGWAHKLPPGFMWCTSLFDVLPKCLTRGVSRRWHHLTRSTRWNGIKLTLLVVIAAASLYGVAVALIEDASENPAPPGAAPPLDGTSGGGGGGDDDRSPPPPRPSPPAPAPVPPAGGDADTPANEDGTILLSKDDVLAVVSPLLSHLDLQTQTSIMNDATSPQRRAVEWIMRDPTSSTLLEDAARFGQRFILASLFYSTGGGGDGDEESSSTAGWMDFDGWLTTAHECHGWYGVKCGKDGQWGDDDGAGDSIPVLVLDESVTYLDLSENNLRGRMPDELGYLRYLSQLLLFGNDVTGTVPSTFGQLVKLHTLYLDRNQIGGSIPTALGSMTSLTNLDLSRNDLEGPIHTIGWGNLDQLVDVRLSGNRLSGEFPYELATASAGGAGLQTLLLDDNSLEGTIPNLVGTAMTSLVALRLHRNEMFGTLPPRFESNVLEEVHLDGNVFDGSIPQFASTTSLRELHLGKNSLSGTVPSHLGDLVALELLNLEFNHLTGPIPEQLNKLAKVKEVRLNNNEFTGQMPQWVGFDAMEQLELLYLNDNQLSGSVAFSLEVLVEDLEALTLNNNKLTGVIPEFVCDLSLAVLSADCSGPSPKVECSCCTSCF